MTSSQIQELLLSKAAAYNQAGFIEDDPISIPHTFVKKQDVEIAAFFAATLSWGQRKTIINKCKLLMSLMDDSPFDFVKNHSESDLKPLLAFKHRTFNATDTLYFVEVLKHVYSAYSSLEEVFNLKTDSVKSRLEAFHDYFFSFEFAPDRTKKHVSTPARKSACKRLNMFLRWMVRKDDAGVDFGIWSKIPTADLICPLDVHVDRVARKLGLLNRKQSDWPAAEELTYNLKKYAPDDPAYLDFALFGLGLEGYANAFE